MPDPRAGSNGSRKVVGQSNSKREVYGKCGVETCAGRARRVKCWKDQDRNIEEGGVEAEKGRPGRRKPCIRSVAPSMMRRACSSVGELWGQDKRASGPVY